MIPKIIHYCWVGNAPKPKSVLYCIESWKKFCPDYEIREWNESNYDFTKNKYMKQAYEAKKWGFVPDYARLDIIYEYGGIYLDTDVELIKNLDNFLENPAFLAYQDSKYIATGLGFGAEKGNKIIKCMLDDYKNCHFCINGEMDLTPCPVRNTNVIKNLLGTEIDAKKISNIKDAVLYPKEYFSPIDCKTMEMALTSNTISIHWFTASWREEEFLIAKEYDDFYSEVREHLGKRSAYIFVTIFYWIFRNKEFKKLRNKWKN